MVWSQVMVGYQLDQTWLMGYLNSLKFQISIELLVMVSGIVISFWSLWFVFGHAQWSLLVIGEGGGYWGSDEYRLFNYQSQRS